MTVSICRFGTSSVWTDAYSKYDKIVSHQTEAWSLRKDFRQDKTDFSTASLADTAEISDKFVLVTPRFNSEVTEEMRLFLWVLISCFAVSIITYTSGDQCSATSLSRKRVGTHGVNQLATRLKHMQIRWKVRTKKESKMRILKKSTVFLYDWEIKE